MSVLHRQDAFAQLKQADQARLAKLEQNELYQQQLSTLPARYQAVALSDLDQHAAQQTLSQALQQYVCTFQERRRAGDNVILSGSVGTGKTHAACAAFKALARMGFRCCYTTCFDLIESIKQKYKLGLPFSEQAKIFLSVDCLILDEIPENLTAANAGLIFQVIDERYNAQRPSILISNSNKSELKRSLGEKALDRVLSGGSLFLNLRGESLRRVSHAVERGAA